MNITFPTVMDVSYICHNLRESEEAQCMAASGEQFCPETLSRHILSSMGEFTFCILDDEGTPLVIGGYIEVRPGGFNSWMIGTEHAWKKHWLGISKIARRNMDALLASGRAHRISDYSLCARTEAHKWYKEALGMTHSHTEKRWYADGQDAECYIKVRNDNGRF